MQILGLNLGEKFWINDVSHYFLLLIPLHTNRVLRFVCLDRAAYNSP